MLARAGLGPVHLLTVVGRTTGRPYTRPVVPVERDGRRFLVAPYGAVAWVHNARAAGRVTLRYGRETRHYRIREVAAREAGPVLKRYVDLVGKTPRSHFSATRNSSVADFVAEADRHPVLELIALDGDPVKP
jgi:deazaflavin-dependent oxidoreductase (nitroreductase family)